MQNFFPLPIRFEKNGFLYWQICRTDKAAIYEQRTKDGRCIWFEVWAIRTQPARVLNGYSYPASERGPGTNDWGHYGWTYYRLPDARARYDQLNGRDNMPAGNGQAKNGIAQAARDAAGTVINALSGII